MGENAAFFPAIRTWIQEKLARCINWRSFKNLIKPDEPQLRVLESGVLSQGRPVEVCDLLTVTNQDFINYRRSHLKRITQLGGNCRQSLERYIEKVLNSWILQI